MPKNKTIEEYEKENWEIQEEALDDICNIITPEGDVFYYYDLTRNICPICSQQDETLNDSEFCYGNHEKRLLRRIEEATHLAKLISDRDYKKFRGHFR